MTKQQTVPPRMRVTHSYDLAGASMLAAHLTLMNLQKALTIENYFAGIYLMDRDALLPFWRDREELQEFVCEVCGLAQPPPFYWIELHAVRRMFSEGIVIPEAKELAMVFDDASLLALKAPRRGPHEKQPLLQVKHFVAAIADRRELSFSQKMLNSGFDARKLRAHLRAGRESRRSPKVESAKPGAARRP